MRGIRTRLGRWMMRLGQRLLAERANCRHEWKLTHGCMSHHPYACTKCGARDMVIARFPITGYKPGAETRLHWMPAPYSVPWSERCKAARAESSAEMSSS